MFPRGLIGDFVRLLPWDYAVRNLGRSPLRLVLSVAGSALVVLLVLAAAAFVRGMTDSLRVSGNAANVIVLGAGSEESIERSEIKSNTGQLVLASVRGIRERLGVAYVSSEVYVQTALRLRADGPEIRAVLRGIQSEAFLVHQQVHITAGRAPEPGRDELLVGRMAATKMGLPSLEIGTQLFFDKRPWTIVGRFEAPGTVMDSEIWCPLRDLQIAMKRDNLSCVIVSLDLEKGAEFADVDAFVRQQVGLELVAMPETTYYRKLASFFRPIQMMVWITAGMIALGGLFGGLNKMYAAFASRVRELATLQAMGYPRRAVVISLVQESILATSAGALLAAMISVFFLDGLAVRFSMGAFGLTIDSTVLLTGLFAGLLLGAIGALPPALRCLRLPIAVGLKFA